jgi:hypothetical protein
MILAFLKRAIGAVRVAKDNVNAFGAAQDAYEGGAALHGVILAYTGATPAAADNLTSAGVMESIDAVRRTTSNMALTLERSSQALELGSRTLADAALELRELEDFIARLQGEASLKAVLEG